MEVAIMIEGQNGLNWPRWQRIAQAVEDLGFVGLYRSDHISGTPTGIVEQLGRLSEVGVQRVMLQWLDQDDLDGLEALARTVLPQLYPTHFKISVADASPCVSGRHRDAVLRKF